MHSSHVSRREEVDRQGFGLSDTRRGRASGVTRAGSSCAARSEMELRIPVIGRALFVMAFSRDTDYHDLLPLDVARSAYGRGPVKTAFARIRCLNCASRSHDSWKWCNHSPGTATL